MYYCFSNLSIEELLRFFIIILTLGFVVKILGLNSFVILSQVLIPLQHIIIDLELNFFGDEISRANFMRSIFHLAENSTNFNSIPFFSNWRCSFIGTSYIFLRINLGLSNLCNRWSLLCWCSTTFFSCLGFLVFLFGNLGRLGIYRLLLWWRGNLFLRLLGNLFQGSRCSSSSYLSLFHFLQSPLVSYFAATK